MKKKNKKNEKEKGEKNFRVCFRNHSQLYSCGPWYHQETKTLRLYLVQATDGVRAVHKSVCFIRGYPQKIPN